MEDASRAPAALTAELDQSAEDLRAGRLKPLGPVLAAMHTRAVTRIADRVKGKTIRARREPIDAG